MNNVYVYNDGDPIPAKWDGSVYVLGPDPVEIERGVAEHWMNRYPDASIRVEDVPQYVIEKRMPANPLEEADRGEAFSGIKRRKRASEE